MVRLLTIAALLIALVLSAVVHASCTVKVPVFIAGGAEELHNYTLKLTLDVRSFPYILYAKTDFSDMYVLDSAGRPLPYWIEKAEKTVTLTVLPRGLRSTVYWRFIVDETPPPDWYKPEFNDTLWLRGVGPIGNFDTLAKTVVTFLHLYARTRFYIPRYVGGIRVARIVRAILYIASDDGAAAYVNGYKVLDRLSDVHAPHYWDYTVDITRYVKFGENVLAVHVYNGGGGRCYLDAEVVVVLELERAGRVVLWTKLPVVEPNKTSYIYLCLGGVNPYTRYNNGELVFLFFDDFTRNTLGTKWINYFFAIERSDLNYTFGVDAYVEDGVLKLEKTISTTHSEAAIASAADLPKNMPYMVVTKVLYPGGGYDWSLIVFLGDADNFVYVLFNEYIDRILVGRKVAGSSTVVRDFSIIRNKWVYIMFLVRPGEHTLVRIISDGFDSGWIDTGVDITAAAPRIKIGFGQGRGGATGTYTEHAVVDLVYVASYTDYPPEITLGDIVLVENRTEIVLVNHTIVYTPRIPDVGYVVYTNNESATSVQTSNYSIVLKVYPYVNKTSWSTPAALRLIRGSIVSGNVTVLAQLDGVVLRVQSENVSNTMYIVVDMNITLPSWLLRDSTVMLREIEISLAGNLSKLVNTRASLEIYDWVSKTWLTVDTSALNVTAATVRNYTLSRLAANLSRLVSPEGVITLRINVTDVQTHPSTLVTLDLDYVAVRITYVNETSARLEMEYVLLVPYGVATLRRLIICGRASLTGTSRGVVVEVLNKTGAVIAAASPSLGPYHKCVPVEIGVTARDLVKIRITLSAASSLTDPEVVYLSMPAVVFEHMSTPEHALFMGVSKPRMRLALVFRLAEAPNRTAVNMTSLRLLVRGDSALARVYKPATSFTLVGTVSVNAVQYRVYEVVPTRPQTYIVEVETPNLLYNLTRYGVAGVKVSLVLVGDTFCIDTPWPVNMTVFCNGERTDYVNVTHICITPSRPAVYVVYVLSSRPAGFVRIAFTSDYGTLRVKLLDVTGKKLDYVNVSYTVADVVRGSVISSKTSTGLFTVHNLVKSRYSISVAYLGVEICGIEINYTTLNMNKTFVLRCNVLRRLDYRGAHRVFMWSRGVVARVLDLSPETPHARTRLILSGHGPVYILVVYGRARPEDVLISGNLTYLRWYWTDNILVISGELSSTAVIDVVDLHRLSVELRDKLGRLLDVKDVYIIVNETVYEKPAVSLLLPVGTYVVKVAERPSGFEITNRSSWNVTLTSSRSYIVYYRVPTNITLNVSLSVLGTEVYLVVSGRLVDYFGEPVPHRPVHVLLVVENKSACYSYTTMTDDLGFYTLVIPVYPNMTYNVRAYFAGDDVYLSSLSNVVRITARVAPPVMPAPPPPQLPYISAVPLVVIGAALFLAILILVSRLRARRAEVAQADFT